jgi:MoaA/NifB/PqqE/SkfB family radical SAM enzyme
VTLSSTTPKPTRVILNFSHKCALKCEWCYVPFGSVPAKLEIVEAIVDWVAKLGFSSITFGGGDPFQHSFIETTLRRAKMSGLFVHVDTHAKSLRQSKQTFTLLVQAVDLLGLPLDGPNAEVHDRMRSTPGHFDLLRRHLDWLKPYRERVKINTVLSAKNSETVPALAELVGFIAPSRWSLYQYWPLGPAERVSSTHCLRDGEFEAKTRRAAELLAGSDTVVEINNQESRRATYPIVQHDGSIFVHAPAPLNNFRYIGSIFEEDAQYAILESCAAERATAATRYVTAHGRDF